MYAGLNNWDPSNNNGLDWVAPPVPGLLVVGATDNDGRIWPGVSTSMAKPFYVIANTLLE